MSQQKSYGGGGQRPLFLQFRQEGRDGRDGLGSSCPEGDDGRLTWTLAKPIVCVFFSPTGILSLFIRYNDLFAGKT